MDLYTQQRATDVQNKPDYQGMEGVKEAGDWD